MIGRKKQMAGQEGMLGGSRKHRRHDSRKAGESELQERRHHGSLSRTESSGKNMEGWNFLDDNFGAWAADHWNRIESGHVGDSQRFLEY